MLLNEFQKVQELDQQITSLQEKLTDLYSVRAKLLTGTKQKTVPASTASDASRAATHLSDNAKSIMAEAEYNKIANSWNRVCIKVPEFSQLEAAMIRGLEQREVIEQQIPILQGRLEFLLVPPSKYIKLNLLHALRTAQKHIKNDDSFDPEIEVKFRTRKWNLFLTLTEKQGIYFDTPLAVIRDKTTIFKGFEALELGLLEYIALSLQTNAPLDKGAYTALLKEKSRENLIPVVTFYNGQYVFARDELDTLFGNVRMRPTFKIGDVS